MIEYDPNPPTLPDLSLPPLEAQPLRARATCGALLLALSALALLMIAALLLSQNKTDKPPPVAACDLPHDPAYLVYSLNAERSEARYSIDERLFRPFARFNRAEGRSNALSGLILIDPSDPAQSRVCEILINAASFHSDNPVRDSVLRRTYLEVDTYPEISFKPAPPQGIPTNAAELLILRFSLSGELTIKDISQPITWEVTLAYNASLSDSLRGTAQSMIKLSDYGLGPIRIGGFVETADQLQLNLSFSAERIQD